MHICIAYEIVCVNVCVFQDFRSLCICIVLIRHPHTIPIRKKLLNKCNFSNIFIGVYTWNVWIKWTAHFSSLRTTSHKKKRSISVCRCVDVDANNYIHFIWYDIELYISCPNRKQIDKLFEKRKKEKKKHLSMSFLCRIS